MIFLIRFIAISLATFLIVGIINVIIGRGEFNFSANYYMTIMSVAAYINITFGICMVFILILNFVKRRKAAISIFVISVSLFLMSLIIFSPFEWGALHIFVVLFLGSTVASLDYLIKVLREDNRREDNMSVK